VLEETQIETILLEYRKIDPEFYSPNNLEIYKIIDTILMTDKFLNSFLPKGNKAEEGKLANNLLEEESTRKVDHFDPDPYRVIAQRIFSEEIKPGKAYYLLLNGLKKGIRELDIDTIIAYETSQLFTIKRNDNSLITHTDLKEMMSVETSYDRF
jgi:hypothetical protein